MIIGRLFGFIFDDFYYFLHHFFEHYFCIKFRTILKWSLIHFRCVFDTSFVCVRNLLNLKKPLFLQ